MDVRSHVTELITAHVNGWVAALRATAEIFDEEEFRDEVFTGADVAKLLRSSLEGTKTPAALYFDVDGNPKETLGG